MWGVVGARGHASPAAVPALAVVLGFFFNDTATTEIYTLSLHDALPIYLPFMRGKNPRHGSPQRKFDCLILNRRTEAMPGRGNVAGNQNHAGRKSRDN